MFAEIFFGHMIGDFFLQPKSMALGKSEKSVKGFFICTYHSVIYTACVCLFLWTADIKVIVLVFLSHWPIDRWSLASNWLRMIKGRDIKEAFYSDDKYRDADLVFSCIVYTVVDSTMHLILLWAITKWIM